MDDLNIRRYIPYVFNYETTLRSDYRRPRVTTAAPKVSKSEVCLRQRPPPLKDSQTLSLRNPKISYVPFNLYHKPRAIIDTHPSDIQKPYYNLEDVNREDVQKTRPRVYMTPAISLDDADEPVRQILVNSTYSTEMRDSLQGVITSTSKNTKAPLSTIFAPPNIIRISRVREPYISPEWRMQSASWDKQQLRSYNDSTAIFWTNRDTTYVPLRDYPLITPRSEAKSHKISTGLLHVGW